MIRTRVVATTALIAASAMILAACGSSPGQSTGTTSASSAATSASSEASSAASSAASDTGGATTSAGSATDTGSASGSASSSAAASSSGGAAGAVGGPACGAPHGAYDVPGAQAGQVTAGYNQLADSLNPNTGHTNSTYDTIPNYFTNMSGGFNYFTDKSELVNNDNFGTCTLVSLDPLTVKYTIKDGVKWSDGVPVSAADLLLQWAAGSGWYGTLQYDANGNPIASKGPAFDFTATGLDQTKLPTISADGKSLTLVYTKFFVDYDLALSVGVPAHVVAQHALKITDPTAATDALVKILQENTTSGHPDKDVDKLKAVADFYNTGFDTTQMPTDKSLLVSDGPYILSDWKKDQYMTFTANPDYTWGPKPSIQTIIWQYAPDPTAAVQSLQNGDLQIVNPQATPDVGTSLTKLADQGVTTINGQGALYEHVNLVFDNGGPFDPKTYGGGTAGAAKALAVRQAFLQTVPRQDIINRLIKPLNPDAVLRQAFMWQPGQAGYDDVIKANGSADYTAAGSDAAIAKAKQILSAAGVDISTVKHVRLMYADNNPRRAQEYQLIAASAKKVGFTVEDKKNANWSALLSNNKVYDASLFAWAETSTAVSAWIPNWKTGVVPNNYGHYSNKDVDKDMADLQSEPDVTKQNALLLDTEKHLWADAFGTLIFQFPDLVGFDSTKVTGVSYAPLSPNFVWDFWDWKLAS